MARFVRGEPVVTKEPFVTVDAGLDPGLHRFQLEVMTEDRRRSKPDAVVVEVTERTGLRRTGVDPLRTDPLRPDDRFRIREPLRPGDVIRRDPLRPDRE